MRASDLTSYKATCTYSLAKSMGIRVFTKPLPDNVNGLYMPGKTVCCVLNELKSPTRQAMILAYLLGVHLYEKQEFTCYTTDPSELMIKPLVFKMDFLTKNGFFGSLPPEAVYVREGVPYRFIASIHKKLSETLGRQNLFTLYGGLRPDGTLSYASAGHEFWLGIHPLDMVDKTPFEFMHPDDKQPVIKEFLEFLYTKQEKSVQFRYINKEGNSVSIRAVGTPIIGEHGDVEEVIVTANVNNIQQEVVSRASVSI